MIYKCASTLVGTFEDGRPLVRNYVAHRGSVDLTPTVLAIIRALRAWQTFADLERACPALPPGSLRETLQALVDASIVVEDAPRDLDVESRVEQWTRWGSAAGHFFFDSKDVVYQSRDVMRRHAPSRILGMPSDEAASVDIPLLPIERSGGLPSVLLDRRSWRRFGTTAVSFGEASTLLGLTFGTTGFLEGIGGVRFRLKTSPSGGACHSLKAYVIVRHVNGIDPGLYEYDGDGHGLIRKAPLLADDDVATWLGGQRWTADASLVVLVTSQFSKVQWKYRSGRALRVVLLEAGHFCQTFCLVATSLRLAPFCTAALADSKIEQALQIDGINEAVIYAMGVGSRPEHPELGAWPDDDESELAE